MGLKFLDDRGYQIGLRENMLFGNVEDQPCPLLWVWTFLFNDLRERECAEHVGGHINGDWQVDAGFGQLNAGFESAQESPFGQQRETLRVRAGHKGCGRQNPVPRMFDAGEDFCAGHITSAQVDLGLIPEFNPAALKRAAQFNLRGRSRTATALRYMDIAHPRISTRSFASR